ncbi:MAG: Hsp20/alpha crystallin family protein [Massilia sp.]
MNLVRRGSSPLSVYRPGSVEDQFGRMVESMFGDFLPQLARGVQGLADPGIETPRLDVSETEKTYEIKAEMPGVQKDDVKVSIDHDRITIEAECRTANEQREGENVVYSERSARKFVRSFQLPSEVDEAAAEAKLDNGILSLTLPKKQGGAARRLTIQ